MPSPHRTIDVTVTERVMCITLDRPDRLNAFTVGMQRELCAALDEADADDGVRAVVVTGQGRAFCAGADLGAGGDTFDLDAPGGEDAATGGGDAEGDDEGGLHRDEGGLVALRIFASTTPVIAAVNGPAVGVGATMTLPMDVRLAGESARFGFVFARRGIVPEACSSWFLPRVVGISTACEWAYSGRVFGAAEAHERGLVRSIHPDGELLDAAMELASEIAASTSAVSIALTRQMMWRMLGADHPMAAHRVDSAAIASLGQSADAREGVMSFLEKRPADFTDRPSADLPPWYPWWDEAGFGPPGGDG